MTMTARAGDVTTNINVTVNAGWVADRYQLETHLVPTLRDKISIHGGGNVQVALGG
jgi:hypothetical protein